LQAQLFPLGVIEVYLQFTAKPVKSAHVYTLVPGQITHDKVGDVELAFSFEII